MIRILGLDLDGDIPESAVPIGAVLIVETINAETSKPQLQVLSTDMTVWHRLGVVSAIAGLDQADLTRTFEDDE